MLSTLVRSMAHRVQQGTRRTATGFAQRQAAQFSTLTNDAWKQRWSTEVAKRPAEKLKDHVRLENGATYKPKRTPCGPADIDAIETFLAEQKSTIDAELAADKDPQAMQKHKVGNRNLLFFKNGGAFLDVGPTDGLLGYGAYKLCTKAIQLDTGDLFAHLTHAGPRGHASMEVEARAFERFGGHSTLISMQAWGRGEQQGKPIMSFIQERYVGDLEHKGAEVTDQVHQIRVAMDILEGLQTMHDAGWAHRDIKPGNILLTSANRAKVIDFGLSGPDGALGTLRYLHPEVAQRRSRVDGPGPLPVRSCARRHDLFAAGLTLGEVFAPEAFKPFADWNQSLQESAPSRTAQESLTDAAVTAPYEHAEIEERAKALFKSQPHLKIFHDMCEPLQEHSVGDYIERLRGIERSAISERRRTS